MVKVLSYSLQSYHRHSWQSVVLMAAVKPIKLNGTDLIHGDSGLAGSEVAPSLSVTTSAWILVAFALLKPRLFQSIQGSKPPGGGIHQNGGSWPKVPYSTCLFQIHPASQHSNWTYPESNQCECYPSTQRIFELVMTYPVGWLSTDLFVRSRGVLCGMLAAKECCTSDVKIKP